MPAAMIYTQPLLSPSMRRIVDRATRAACSLSPEDGQAAREHAERCAEQEQLRAEARASRGKVRRTLKH